MTTLAIQQGSSIGASSPRRAGFVVEAVVVFPPLSSARSDSMPFRLELFGNDERASSLVRLNRLPASPSDVVEGTAEIVTTVALLFSRWELRARHDDSLLTVGGVPPIGVQPFRPLVCVVRLFGRG